MDIHVLHQQGHSIRAISRQLGIARNTVRCYLRDIARTPSYGPRPDRPSKLEPFKPRLNRTGTFVYNAILLFSNYGCHDKFYISSQYKDIYELP